MRNLNKVWKDKPVKEITQWLPAPLIPLAEKIFNDMVGKYDLEEGYNLEAAKIIKPVIGKSSLIVVGVFRTLSLMEEIM